MHKKINKTWTILVCCYNCTATIKQTINSIIFNNNNDIDVLLVDDGSKDDLYAVIKPFLEKYPNQLHYYRKQNGNQGSCINFALKHANSKFFSLLDSDDTYTKKNFNKVLNILRKLNVNNTDLILTNFYLNQISVNPHIMQKYVISHTTRDYKITNVKLLTTPSRSITIHSSIYNLKKMQKYCHLPENISYADNVMYYQYFLHMKNIVYLNKNIFLYKYTINKDKQLIYIKNSINKLDEYIKIFNYFLSIPLYKSNKQQINIAINVFKNFTCWMLVILSQNYNYSNESKKLIIKQCIDKIKKYEINNKLEKQITPILLKIFNKSTRLGSVTTNFLCRFIPIKFLKAIKWTKSDKYNTQEIKKNKKHLKKFIHKHKKILFNSSDRIII